jgi:hypothetical protein
MLQCFKHDKYGLKIKVFAYIKNEGANLHAMTTFLKIVVSFKSLGLKEALQGTCFQHALLKACRYGTTNLNFFYGLTWHLYQIYPNRLSKMHNMA